MTINNGGAVKKGMSEITKRTIAWAIAGTFMVLAVAALLVVVVWRVSGNDRAKVVRDQQVRVACVQAGGELLNGNNCVPISNAGSN